MIPRYFTIKYACSTKHAHEFTNECKKCKVLMTKCSIQECPCKGNGFLLEPDVWFRAQGIFLGHIMDYKDKQPFYISYNKPNMDILQLQHEQYEKKLLVEFYQSLTTLKEPPKPHWKKCLEMLNLMIKNEDMLLPYEFEEEFMKCRDIPFERYCCGANAHLFTFLVIKGVTPFKEWNDLRQASTWIRTLCEEWVQCGKVTSGLIEKLLKDPLASFNELEWLKGALLEALIDEDVDSLVGGDVKRVRFYEEDDGTGMIEEAAVNLVDMKRLVRPISCTGCKKRHVKCSHASLSEVKLEKLRDCDECKRRKVKCLKKYI